MNVSLRMKVIEVRRNKKWVSDETDVLSTSYVTVAFENIHNELVA